MRDVSRYTWLSVGFETKRLVKGKVMHKIHCISRDVDLICDRLSVKNSGIKD